MRLSGVLGDQLPGFLQRECIHASIGQGFDIADTIIIVIRRKAARLFPER